MIKDGLSYGAWLARGDGFLASLVLVGFAFVPLAVAFLGLFRFLRGGRLYQPSTAQHQSTAALTAGAPTLSDMPEPSAGPVVVAIAASGALAAMLTHLGVVLAVMVAWNTRGFVPRHGVLVACAVVGLAAAIAWLPTLEHERLWFGRQETQERLSFWTLLLAEVCLSAVFIMTT